MAKINLRPWRDELRKERQQEYLAILGVVAIAAFGIYWLVSGAYQGAIDTQRKRNQYLEVQSKAMDEKIAEIRELQDKRNQLLDRMKLIQDLQGNRPVIVRVFDELARITPEELFFERIVVSGNMFSLNGRASSNQQISQLMRNFDGSQWFKTPNLLGVDANKGNYNKFDMTVLQTSPLLEEEVKK